MKTITRRTSIVLGALAAGALAAPAFAAPSTSPTSLNLRAGKTVVKAHSSDTFTATLSSKGKGLAAQTVYLQERTAPTTGHTTTWTDVTVAGNPVTATTDTNGHASFTATPPIAAHKSTQKDQYRAEYKGDTAYGKSHSAAVTITVKRS